MLTQHQSTVSGGFEESPFDKLFVKVPFHVMLRLMRYSLLLRLHALLYNLEGPPCFPDRVSMENWQSYDDWLSEANVYDNNAGE